MHGSFLLPWDLVWSLHLLRFAVRPLPPHRTKALLSACPDGLGAINREEAGLSRLSPGQDGRRHHGHSLDGDLAGWRPSGTVRDRLGLSPPCQQARGLLPRGSPRTLLARLTAIPRTASHPARVSYHNAAQTLSVATATVRTNPASAQGTRGTTTI